MAKSTLINDQKFQLLVSDLGMPVAHVLGHLEMMWQAAYSSCSPVLRSRAAIEITAGWVGEKGVFAEAVLDPLHNFVDAREDGQFLIHDFWEHAPDYVKKRQQRADERKLKLVKRRAKKTYSGGQRRTTADNGGFCPPGQPNRTEPNPTQGNKADPPDPPLPPKAPASAPSVSALGSAQSRADAPKQRPASDRLNADIEAAVSRLMGFEHERNRGHVTALMWRIRVRAMARAPDGLFAVMKLCDECETRRNPRAAETKGYSREPIRDEPAWLNQQTRQWIENHDRKAQ